MATWAGRWALGAGGSVEVGESPVETLSRELDEEWSVQPEKLSVEALVRLPSGLVLLVGLADLPAGAEPVPDEEHDTFAWWPAALMDFSFAPAWPRLAALACAAVLGISIGLSSYGARIAAVGSGGEACLTGLPEPGCTSPRRC